ncbi:hypothetical protein BDB01DRAFT_780389 [Pilobolus umbonatus]|nr:hypothetical protein BDB01DRAFT_780389 [Pilobolus umbonatus]
MYKPFSVIILLVICLLSLCGRCKAQIGPKIFVPEQNQTVEAGEKSEISYQYSNLGDGDYKIDIQLWKDSAVTVPIQDIVIDYPIQPGNSTGVQVPFTYNATYTWKVPKGLDEIFWMTLTCKTVTPLYPKGVVMRSRPVLLHTSAASLMSNPASFIGLLLLSSCVFLFMY